jgi:threonine dehydrogenase-like Zn-dependent dehydrogenase
MAALVFFSQRFRSDGNLVLMRALVIAGPGTARVEEVEAAVPDVGQVVVDVRRAGICGTDVELFTGQMAYFGQGKTWFPVRPGHEWCGVVSAVGAGVPAGWLGVRVTGDTMLGCGRCARCRAGRGHVCADRYEVGISGGWPGALAEQVAVPVSSLHRLPSGLDDRAGALVEPGGNAWRAASAAGAAPGRRVLVCGPGTIGLLTTAFAAAAGAEVHILAVDEGRRSLASSFGATGYWTADDAPPVTYDSVVDCTGDHRVPALALALAEPAGRVVFIGVSGAPSLIDSRDLVLGDLTAVGILGASAGLAPAIEHYADGRVDPSGLVDVTVGLSRAAEALAGQISSGSGTKIHIDPGVLGAITWRSLVTGAVVQGAVQDGDRAAGEVDPVAVDGGTDQAGAVRDLQAGEGVMAQAVRPVGGQGGVGATGDGIFGDAACWCEVPGDEVVATMPVRRGGGDDDPADAVPAGKAS